MSKFLRTLQPARFYASEALKAVEQDIKTKSAVALNSEFFEDAKKRIHGEGRSVKKVVITVKEPNGTAKTHLVNENVSTPLTCAKHVSRALASDSAICRVTYDVGGNTVYSSVHEPFTRKCEVEFLNMNATSELDSKLVNEAYWRSTAVLLGATISKGVRNSKQVEVDDSEVANSYFSAKLKDFSGWIPSSDELLTLSRFANSEFIKNCLPFEHLQLSDELAEEYGFAEGFRLCRLGDFVTKVYGPTIANSEQIGKFTILKSIQRGSDLSFAGTSVPAGQTISSYSWSVIQEHASDLFK